MPLTSRAGTVSAGSTASRHPFHCGTCGRRCAPAATRKCSSAKTARYSASARRNGSSPPPKRRAIVARDGGCVMVSTGSTRASLRSGGVVRSSPRSPVAAPRKNRHPQRGMSLLVPPPHHRHLRVGNTHGARPTRGTRPRTLRPDPHLAARRQPPSQHTQHCFGVELRPTGVSTSSTSEGGGGPEDRPHQHPTLVGVGTRRCRAPLGCASIG